MTKIAVAIIHGVGAQDSRFAEDMINELRKRFVAHLPKKVTDPSEQIVFEPVYWAPVLQNAQNRLLRKLKSADLDYIKLREFFISFGGDAIAYQPTPQGSQVYLAVHKVFADTLQILAGQTSKDAPLCVIAHSLGTVIASNFLYDLQKNKTGITHLTTALQRGETLSHFYTMGSPLAVWALRYKNFGTPINVPSNKFLSHHPKAQSEWVNFYDKDDVIGYPLKKLNDAYKKAVKKDVAVNVGGITTSWNPASHVQYWTDNDITKQIAKSLAKAWIALNKQNG